MKRFPVPGEQRLKRLIHDAHEYAPGPDMARLQALEDRLLRGPARRPRPAPGRWLRRGWLLLLLAGGLATAAWWNGWLSPAPGPVPARDGGAPAPSRGPEPAPGPPAGDPDQAPAPDSPVIYQREGAN